MFSVRRSNVALVSSTDFLTFLSGSSRGIVLLELDFNGQGTASSQGELGIYVCTSTGTTPGGAITAQPINTRYSAVAAAATIYTTWSVAPTIGSEPIHTIPINGNGERYRWIWNGDWGNAITIAPGTAAANYLTFRQIAGTPTVTGRIRFAEV